MSIRVSLPCLCLGFSKLVQAFSGVISTDTFSSCSDSSAQITVTNFDFKFSRSDAEVNFYVAGTSSVSANVTAQVNITAYGIPAYGRTFDPCANSYNITQLCPVDVGPFTAGGSTTLPADILADIPSIIFAIPDLSGMVTMRLFASDGASLICLKASVSNGKTLASSSVQAVTGAVAAGAIVISGAASIAASLSVAGSISSGSSVTTVSSSPNMGDMLLWFQAVGINGMLSVTYPSILRSFYSNFGWTLGLGPWINLQKHIDNFRSQTGGNLTASSFNTLDSSPLQFSDSISPGTTVSKRKISQFWARSNSLISNNSATSNTTTSSTTTRLIGGIDAYVEQLKVPSQNTFTTIFLIFLIVIGCVCGLSLLGRIVLELAFRTDKLPKGLRSVRINYWFITNGVLIRFILVIFGTWSLFCLHQFRHGDSWAATLLAGVSLGVFIGVILFFTIQIISIVWQAKGHGKASTELLYHHKPHLRKFGLFYEQFKERFWWFFVPCIIYSFLKASFIAFGDGHGLVQVIGCITCEFILLVFLFTTQAYDGTRANVVNIMIGCVRIISLAGTLLFVDILGFRETTTTITGVVLIVVQSLLTLILVSLVILNGVMPLFRKKQIAGGDAGIKEEMLPLEPFAALQEKSAHGGSGISYNPNRRASAMSALSVNSSTDAVEAWSILQKGDYSKALNIDEYRLHDDSSPNSSDTPISTQAEYRIQHNSDAYSMLAAIYDTYDNEGDPTQYNSRRPLV